MEELLSLKWNNHRSTFLHILSILRDKQLYTDATLACDGKFYNVHRLVLSTCSDYFSAMFDRTTTCKNPIIVLKDIKCQDLEALLDYMYLGEVNVRQADLASLIKAAECLQVKGLAVPDDEPPSSKRSKSDNSNVRRSSDMGQGSPAAKRKRKDFSDATLDRFTTTSKSPESRLSSTKSPTPKDMPDIPTKVDDNVPPAGDIPYVKVEQEDDDIGIIENFDSTEFKEEMGGNDSGDPGGSRDSSSNMHFMQQPDADGNFDPGFEGSSSFQHDNISWQVDDGSDGNYSNQLDFSSNDTSQNAQGGSGAGAERRTSQSSGKTHQCSYCGRIFSRKTNLIPHLRTHTGEKPFKCPHCSYAGAQKSSLQSHMYTRHKVLS